MVSLRPVARVLCSLSETGIVAGRGYNGVDRIGVAAGGAKPSVDGEQDKDVIALWGREEDGPGG